ncbi:MAG: NAD(P)H-binding protein [Pseudomonadota bacterium]|uniref:NmrA family NAD(P)-binding protein n=1 Tax=Alteriqipengyuania lutimaris TaxID=1538146 RepID=UPI001CFE090C|nr:NAD(P)H-binding protein [Alteriqipengyuania lutimaris]MEC8180300.1 NAD(P)H-binding protein [Pseudomonadota bacterium]
MILVTGANGHLGRAIVEHLSQRTAPAQIIAASREPGSLAPPDGIAVRRADFADPASLPEAFAGMERIEIVSVDKLGEEARRLHRNAIAAASDAGVERIFYTSHAGAREGSPFPPADQHAKSEADLEASGTPFTALRHGFYAESCLQMIGEDLKRGELRVPEDGPVCWTARDDLARADAALLAGEATFDGATPPLTASRAWTMSEIAELASQITGREIRHTVVSDAEWKAAKVAAGVPEHYAEMLLGTFRASRRGDFSTVDPTLETLLDRKPTPLRDVLAAALTPAPPTDQK